MPHSRAARGLAWLPVALLLVVVAAHLALRRCCGLHPWLGGGFGMFSSVDERRLRAFRVDAAGEREIEIPRELEDAAERASALPAEPWLRWIAGALAADPAQAGAAVRVEVIEIRYDRSMRPAPRRLGSAVVGP
jgi:hypothetical protein